MYYSNRISIHLYNFKYSCYTSSKRGFAFQCVVRLLFDSKSVVLEIVRKTSAIICSKFDIFFYFVLDRIQKMS